MKKVLALMLALILLLGGCGKSGAKDVEITEVPIEKNYVVTAQVEYDGLSMCATIDRDDPGVYVIAITAPKSLEGMQFAVSAELVEITYMGITAQFDPESFRSSAVVKSMIDVLENVANEQGMTASLKDGVFYLAGEVASGTFEVLLDAENGHLLSLNVPKESLSVTFSNFVAG